MDNRPKPAVVKTLLVFFGARVRIMGGHVSTRDHTTKDGKVHRYWSIVENRRLPGGRVQQRHVLYLGEINSSQERAWRKSIEVFDERTAQSRALSLFPEDRIDEALVDESVVRLCLSQLRLCRPRVWGSCWLALKLWERLGAGSILARSVCRKSRKGTRWDQVLFVLVAYRLLSPGSEWRLHRHWFERSALADLLGADAGAWPTSTSSMPVTTSCWTTSARSSIIWAAAGRISSASNSTSCSTT